MWVLNRFPFWVSRNGANTMTHDFFYWYYVIEDALAGVQASKAAEMSFFF